MDGRGRWVDNVFVERLWRSVKYEDVYLKGYEGTVKNCVFTKSRIGVLLITFSKQVDQIMNSSLHRGRGILPSGLVQSGDEDTEFHLQTLPGLEPGATVAA